MAPPAHKGCSGKRYIPQQADSKGLKPCQQPLDSLRSKTCELMRKGTSTAGYTTQVVKMPSRG